MDVTQALKDAENALRDFIAYVLREKHGNGWIQECGVSENRIETWRDRQEEDQKRQKTGTADERLLYYANFYDLETILKKHWSGEFSTAFGKWKTMQVFLKQLGMMRNPDAHRRELLPHQKHLALGISGDIRNRIVRYRSKMETSEDYYPRLESVQDNLGNAWTPDKGSHIFTTDARVRVGDTLQFVVAATDPKGEQLSYGVKLLHRGGIEWQSDNVMTVEIKDEDVRKMCDASIRIRSSRQYHAKGDYDDVIAFRYEVLPPR